MKKSSGSPFGLYTVGIAVLFLAGFLSLVVFGAQIYRDVAACQTGNNETRALLSYVANCVKSGDRKGNISVRDSEYGQVLVIADSSGYALHIYCSGGRLLEEYSAENAPLNPERASTLGETERFTIETTAENALTISTDAGSVLLVLRSGGRPT